MFKAALEPYTVPSLIVNAAEEEDPLLVMLAGQEAESPSVKELLHGGWVRAHYAHDRACPATVARWLFGVACHHRRAETSAAAARTLGALLDGSTAPAWVPQPGDFLVALRRHGADLAELGPDAEAAAAAIDAGADQLSAGAASTSGAADEYQLDDPRQNVLATLELLTPCARRWAACTPMDERVGAARWIARMMLERHTAPAFVHLQEAFAHTLDGAPEARWAAEWEPRLLRGLRALCAALPHTAVVRVLEFLPPTLRASVIQRRAAVDAIRLLAHRRQKQHRADGRAENAARKQQRRAAAEARKARRESGEEEEGSDDDEEDDDEEDDEDEEEEEDNALAEAGGVDGGATELAEALLGVEASMYKGHMEVLHSILVLTNVAISAEPERLRGEREALAGVKQRLGQIKNRAQRYRGAIDYHGLECESLASYLGNQLELLYLAGEE